MGRAFLPLDMSDPRQHYGADVSSFMPMSDINAKGISVTLTCMGPAVGRAFGLTSTT